jgi:hypothetical protein
LQFTNNAVSVQWASITATNGTLNLNATNVNTSSTFNATLNVVANNGTQKYVTVGDWSSSSNYGVVQGNKGYVILGNTVGDSAMYVRTGTAGNVNIGAQDTNTLQVGNNTATMNGSFLTTGYIAVGGTGYTDAGSVSASGWFRSKGQTGWYNQDYGGGIYMIDTDWVRTYNGKNFYSSAQIRANYFSYENTDVSASADYVVRDGTIGRLYIKSSKRDSKENIEPIPGALSTINKLSPQIFNWKMSEEDKQDEYQILTKQTHKTMGFILEDVVDVSPELVTWRKKEEDGSLYPGYWKTDDFIALAIQGVKDLSKKVSDLELELSTLKGQK